MERKVLKGDFMFYEKKANKLEYMALSFLSSPSYVHFHNEVEIVINMGEGANANVYINAQKYSLKNEGDAVLVTPRTGSFLRNVK